MKVSEARLSQMLSEALGREDLEWRPLLLSNQVQHDDDEITAKLHEDTLTWLLGLSCRCQCYPECFALTVSILDKFLYSVKARPKHLRCAATSCFFIAAKMTEEDEMIPTIRHLVKLTEDGSRGVGLSIAELIRMEAAILDKLAWNVNPVTPLHFLQIFHAMVIWRQSSTGSAQKDGATPSDQPERGSMPSRQLAAITAKLLRFQCRAEARTLRPSVVAISLLSLELASAAPWGQPHDWLPITLWLQNYTKVSLDELVHCRELIATALYQPSSTIAQHKLCKRKIELCHERRRSEHNDSDDVYDGIKRLYGDELDLESPPAAPSTAASAACAASRVLA